jgi:hypothetical protein
MKTLTKSLLLKVFGPLFFMALMSVQAMAQVANPASPTVLLQYDLDSTTEIFASLDAAVVNDPVPVSAAGSVTLTGTNAFANVAVGDYIKIYTPTANYERSVIARASANSITISGAAITVTNGTMQHRTLRSTATLISDVGSFDVSRYQGFTVQIDITQLSLVTPGTSSIDARILCRAGANAQWLQQYPVLAPPTVAASYVSSVAVGGWAREITGRFSECRVGLKINAADDAVDTLTAAEQVTVSVQGVK